VQGHAAQQEPSSEFRFEWVSGKDVEENKKQLEQQAKAEAMTDEDLIKKVPRARRGLWSGIPFLLTVLAGCQIHALPPSNEKRVISYGLYGKNPKYTRGAIRNAELVDSYFPGGYAFTID
jgi:hypothetical protein